MLFSRIGSNILVLMVVMMMTDLSLFGQSLVPVSAGATENTAYPDFAGTDPIYFFCAGNGGDVGSLKASSSGGQVVFLWERWDVAGARFVQLTSETATTSTLKSLADGCYRVSFTENGKSLLFRAWVMNCRITAEAKTVALTCTNLRLTAVVTGSDLRYYDLKSGKPVLLNQGFRFKWFFGNQSMGSVQDLTLYSLPATDGLFRVEITDKAGCFAASTVSYGSPVPTAQFTWTTTQKSDPQYTFPQAPAQIDFQNQSINSDPGKYEWYLFRDRSVLDAMGGGTAAIDSFLAVLYDDSPLFTYELSGKYKVKLIAAKTTQGLTCRDTFYLPDYIVVDTSLVKVSPVFTPNGDGINDKLILKTRSLASLDFSLFNRWGKLVYSYSNSNYIPADTQVAAWDGKVNGNLCPAGVYFYVVDAKGRDGVRRRSKGFIELIR
ncbi:MAG: gliding motility-associated C-terminal domain-containing protein [Marinilabiliales bacterium]|nr:gliding motility-associated C-terminal domain-containing protein [Marinilabiliales bacterium]